MLMDGTKRQRRKIRKRIKDMRKSVTFLDLSLDKYSDEDIYEGLKWLNWIATSSLAIEGLDKLPKTGLFRGPDAEKIKARNAIIQECIKAWVKADLGKLWEPKDNGPYLYLKDMKNQQEAEHG